MPRESIFVKYELLFHVLHDPNSSRDDGDRQQKETERENGGDKALHIGLSIFLVFALWVLVGKALEVLLIRGLF
jgi:hypothetical protein